MITRPVAVVCTGYGTHPVRELVVLVPVRPRRDIEQVLAMQGQTYEPSDDVERGFGVESSMVTEDLKGRRVRRKGDARLINTPGIGWQVATEGCKTCGEKAVVRPVQMLATYVEAHFPPGAARVDVDIRPA